MLAFKSIAILYIQSVSALPQHRCWTRWPSQVITLVLDMAVAVDGTKRLARVTPGGKNKELKKQSGYELTADGVCGGGQPTASVCCFDSTMRLKDSLAVCWEQRLNVWPYLRLSLLHWFIYLYFVLFVSSCWTVSATMESADWRRVTAQTDGLTAFLSLKAATVTWRGESDGVESRQTRVWFRVGGSGQVFPPCLW